MTQGGPITMPRSLERYRASILASGGFFFAVVLTVSNAFADGTPFGAVSLLTVLFGVLVVAAVYFPANEWIKFGAGIAGAVGQTLISAITDGVFTRGEITLTVIAFATAMGIGIMPNAPTLVVGEAGTDVP